MNDVTVNAALTRLPSGSDTILVQVSVEQPSTRAIAIILDMSDSCQLGGTEINHCPQLLKLMPRRWPLWLYRLSSCEPLVELDRFRIEDLQDERLKLEEFLHNSHRATIGHDCGSFIQPVIYSIEDDRVAAGLDAVTVLAICDGELLDFAPCELSDSLRVIGISAKVDPAKRNQWQRVLPSSPIYSLDDRRLDNEFTLVCSPYYGHCELRWQAQSELQANVMRFDVNTGALSPLTGNKAECNLASAPLVLRFPLSREEFSELRWTCKSLQTNTEIPLHVALDQANFPSTVLDAVLDAEPSIAEVSSSILVDATTQTKHFSSLWEDARKATEYADRAARWLDSEERLLFFRELGLQDAIGKSKHHALLCLIRGDLTEPVDSNSRIVILALDSRSKPALRWTPEDQLDFLPPAQSGEIYFDAARARWLATYSGQGPQELEPFGSQKLAGPLIEHEGWTILFSGKLA